MPHCEFRVRKKSLELRFWGRKLFSLFIDLLMGLFRGAVFQHGGVSENSPLTLMGRFPTSMGRFPKCLNGPFALSKIPWKTAHQEKGYYRSSKWHYKQRKHIFELIMHFIADTDTDKIYLGDLFFRSRCRHSCSLQLGGPHSR